MERRKKMAPRIDWKKADAKPPWPENDPTTRSGYSVKDMLSVEVHPDIKSGGGAKPRTIHPSGAPAMSEIEATS